MNKGIFKARSLKINVSGVFVTLALIVGCGNAETPVAPVPVNNPAAAAAGLPVIDGNWRLSSLSCVQPEDSYLYRNPNSVQLILQGQIGTVTIASVSPTTCTATAAISASFPTMGQVVLSLTSPFTLMPSGCSFSSDYTKTDLYKDLATGVPFLLGGPIANGGYGGGYGVNPSIAPYPLNSGVSGTTAPLLTLTSQTILPCEVGGQQANHVLSFTH